MESTVVPGLVDSVARPGSGRFVSEQHATTASPHLPRVAPVHTAALRHGSVILKMKRVDPTRARVSAPHGGCDAAGLRGGDDIGSQVGPAAFDGSGLSFRSAIHLHGSTPHRESGVVSGARAGDMRRSPTGQTRPHASPVTGDRQLLERMAGTGASASGAGTASARTATRFNERPAITPTGRRHGFYEGCPPSRDLKGHGQPDSKIRPSGAGNDCDAFRSRELAIRRAIGSLQLTPQRAARQHRRAAIGGLCGRFRVAMHWRSTWLHFTTHDSSRAAPRG